MDTQNAAAPALITRISRNRARFLRALGGLEVELSGRRDTQLIASLDDGFSVRLGCREDSVAVDGDRVLDVIRIAARVSGHDGNVARPRGAKDQFIPLLQTFNRQI